MDTERGLDHGAWSVLQPMYPAAYDWASAFDQTVMNCIMQKNHAALCDYSKFGQIAALSIPTAEHYLPLLYVLAQQQNGEPLRFFNPEVMSSISIRSLQIG